MNFNCTCLLVAKELHAHVEEGIKINLTGRCTAQLVKAVQTVELHMCGKGQHCHFVQGRWDLIFQEI